MRAAPRSGGFPDLLEVALIGLLIRMTCQQEIGESHRHCQQIVEVVRHAGDELPNGFHLLRLTELLLGRS